jgi:hypothetical protein
MVFFFQLFLFIRCEADFKLLVGLAAIAGILFLREFSSVGRVRDSLY